MPLPSFVRPHPLAHEKCETPLIPERVELGRSFFPPSKLKSPPVLEQLLGMSAREHPTSVLVPHVGVSQKCGPEPIVGSQCAPDWNAQMPLYDQPPKSMP